MTPMCGRARATPSGRRQRSWSGRAQRRGWSPAKTVHSQRDCPPLRRAGRYSSACSAAALSSNPACSRSQDSCAGSGTKVLERCFADILSELRELAPETDEESAGRTLRIARRRAALTVALADISGIWTLEEVTGALSRLADTACSTAFRLLLTRLVVRGVLAPPEPSDPESGSGLIALGLGKLGGYELNYSSDIDLILLFEPEAVPAKRGEDVERHLVRLARRFVALLSQRTADGYAFRVDLRLRPDPSATPLVVSAEAARHYYRERGRTWERAALIKARPIAGDTVAARAFLDGIAPFIWRQNLDFVTVQELHDIKRQIDAQHGAAGFSRTDTTSSLAEAAFEKSSSSLRPTS